MSTNIDQLLQDLGSALKNPGTTTASRGIKDTATREQMIISDLGVYVGNLRVDNLVGNFGIENAEIVNLKSTLKAEFNDATVNGKLSVNTLQVKRIITDQSQDTYTKPIIFNAENQTDLDGKGFIWRSDNTTDQLVFKSNRRQIFSTADIDLNRNCKFSIDGVVVIETDRLGPGIKQSNLRKVGVLESLKVQGNVELSETVFINSALNRFALNTEQPNATFSLVENNVEIIAGVNENDQAFIGTWNDHQLDIVTDNTRRISIKGNVTEFGSLAEKNAVVKVHGVLEVDNIVSDLRIERTGPIEFTPNPESGIYSKGLLWKVPGANKQFFLMPNPDRFYSTENIDLAPGKSFQINGRDALSNETLGSSIRYSSLTRVGALETLRVDGIVDLYSSILINTDDTIFTRGATFRDASGTLKIKGGSIDSERGQLELKTNNQTHVSVDQEGNITIGTKEHASRKINAYGQLAVNVTNPLPGVSLSVGGSMMLDGRRFAVGELAPTTGDWNRGDIIWNSVPQDTGYVGWVCIMSGTPGVWKPFGYIGDR